jgi:RHS repeat-associated protein
VPDKKKRVNYYPFGLKHKGYNNIISSNGNSTAQKYRYNGKEFNDELGLNLYDYGARMYDPSLGRWFVSDKLADDVMQVDKSPYAYSWNSPISLNDPDGNCPWCLGAVLGAATEYLVQAGTNLANGDSLGDALWNNVDGADVLIAAGEGALTGGASALKKIAITATAEVLKSSIDAFGSGDVDVIGTESSNKTISGVAKDAVIGTVVGESLGKVDLSGKLVNASSDAAVKSAKSNVKATSKNLTKSNNIRANGNGAQAARGSNASTPGDAFKKFNKAKNQQATTKALNSTVGKVNSNAVKTTVNSAQGVVVKKAIDEIKKQE